jgi:hypothetical protein
MMSNEEHLNTAPEPSGSPTPNPRTNKAAAAVTKGSKSDAALRLLRRAKGATLAELQDLTAWQPHSVRAFLSGLRKKGSCLIKEQRKSRETAYRLTSKATAVSVQDA